MSFSRKYGLLLATGLVSLFARASALAATIRVPDDHRTIQAAIDSAEFDDVVLVKSGIYRERIRLRPRITVKSEGDDSRGNLGLKRAETTIIDGNFEGAQGAGVEMADGATLDGFSVTGIGEYDEASWNRHHATHGEEQPHERIGERGLAGVSAKGITCTIRNNIVHHLGYTGISIQAAKGERCSPHVYRNVCYRNMAGGIGSLQQSTALIEENVCFENFYAGIGHSNASPTVINNICYANIRAGIGISEGSCPIVRGNKCYQNRRAGIGVRTGSSTRPIIEDNDCYENGMAGIGSREEAAPVIRDNRCYRNTLAGIGSQTKATPMIIGNECYENGQAGIGQQSDAVTMLIGNYSHHNRTAGIGFESCAEGESTVIDNRVVENAKVAVGIRSGWTVSLSGNEFSRQDGLPPIIMVFKGSSATFTKNVIRGGGVSGIRVAGHVRAVNNEFAGTSLRQAGPPNFAVWSLPGSEITMTENKIYGWRHALHASESIVSSNKNTVSDFGNVAFVIQKSPTPPDVYGNTVISKNPNSDVVDLDGEPGVIRDNHAKLAE